VQAFTDAIYHPATLLAEALDKPSDQAIYFVASFASIASSFALKQIQAETYKKVFCLAAGLTINFYVFGISALASLSQNILSYTTMVLLPTKYQHVAVFFTSALVLALAQLHKQIYTPGVNGLDVPMNLMFNFCRVTSLVCAVSDGVKLKTNGEQDCGLKTREKKFAITEGIPPLLDFWAYMYFCGGCISGPWFEFKDFQQYMRHEAHYRTIPSTVLATLKRVCMIAVLIVLSVIMSQFFDEHYLKTPQFKASTFISKILYLVGVLVMTMSTYCIGFCFMECGMIASGISYNGNDDHDRIKSVSIRGLLVSTQVKGFLASWNISVHEWLKYYVYVRMLGKGKSQAFAAFTAFMVSAIWHGFYPGFYSFFIGAFLLDYQNKLAANFIKPLSWAP
jgi:D-alanyl-lipoteichoic acid acyltransferase DltB (MBOAT superfamily)